MGVEGDGDGLGFLLLRALDDVAKDGLMGAVDAVEVADTDDGGTEVGGDFFEVAEEAHRARFRTPVSCRRGRGGRGVGGQRWSLGAAGRDRCG